MGSEVRRYGDDPAYTSYVQPEHTLLYQLVEQHYPAFSHLMAKAERPLPDFVQQEFDAFGGGSRFIEQNSIRNPATIQADFREEELYISYTRKRSV